MNTTETKNPEWLITQLAVSSPLTSILPENKKQQNWSDIYWSKDQEVQTKQTPLWPVIFSDYIYIFAFNKINLWYLPTLTNSIFYAIKLYMKHQLFHKEKSSLKFE